MNKISFWLSSIVTYSSLIDKSLFLKQFPCVYVMSIQLVSFVLNYAYNEGEHCSHFYDHNSSKYMFVTHTRLSFHVDAFNSFTSTQRSMSTRWIRISLVIIIICDNECTGEEQAHLSNEAFINRITVFLLRTDVRRTICHRKSILARMRRLWVSWQLIYRISFAVSILFRRMHK